MINTRRRLRWPARLLAIAATTIAAAAAAGGASAQAATLNVCQSGCTYSSIQSAVNAASAGDTIAVAAGTYTESVSIPSGKDGLTIAGAEAGVPAESSGPTGRGNGESVVNPSGEAFDIQSNSVTIDGFTVNDGSIAVWQRNTVSGLRLLDTIFDNEGDAVIPDSTGVNTTLISHNAFLDAASTAPFEYGDGIVSGANAGNLLVEHNTFAADPHSAVTLYGERSSGVTISDNTTEADAHNVAGPIAVLWGADNVSITGNTGGNGLFVNDSHHVTVEGNRLTAYPGGFALWLAGSPGNEDQDVHIEHNDIGDNTVKTAVLVNPNSILGTLDLRFNRIQATRVASRTGATSRSMRPTTGGVATAGPGGPGARPSPKSAAARSRPRRGSCSA